MATTSRRPASRVFRPSTEGLESRKLLAKVLSGVDVDGDQWVLRLTGPGDLRVVNQPVENGVDEDGFPIFEDVPLGQPGLIQEIGIGGTDPLDSRLTGTVTRGPEGDGRIYFQEFEQFNGQAVNVVAFNGVHIVDMPDFWLGRTSTDTPFAGTTAASLNIPDGVNTLRFGGVDASFTAPGGTPLNANGQNDLLVVRLGLPRSGGTDIVIEQSISTAQAPVGTSPTPTQDGVQFSVIGRLNEFQANEIIGDSRFPSGGFQGEGGTVVISSNGFEPNAVDAGELTSTVTGQVGFARVGGNATNFSVESADKISNFYVGGETDNVQVLAPGGSRHVLFGRGMDTVRIYTQTIAVLQANRGAIGSQVLAQGLISQLLIGGDVVDTEVRSGYDLGLNTVLLTQSPPDPDPRAIAGGHIKNALIAGDVVDSIFVASVQPFEGQFGTPNDLLLTQGTIHAKVEGTINNTLAVPDAPGKAFFAKNLQVKTGPVVPPRVVEPPFPHEGAPPRGPRIAKTLLPTNPNALSRQARIPTRRLNT